jgi:hypothetical protein
LIKNEKKGTTGHFYKKLKKIFFRDFLHLKLSEELTDELTELISDLKNNFRFEFGDPKLVGIDTHIAIVSGFAKGPVRNLPPEGPGPIFFIGFGFLDPKLV